MADRQVGASFAILTYDAPFASHVRLNAPHSGGLHLSIHGLGFGAVDLTSSAMLSFGQVPEYTQRLYS